MRVKELIEELKKCDQNSLVTCGRNSVWFVNEIPWYWDGLAINDHNTIGNFSFLTDGNKVNLELWNEDTWFESNCLTYNREKQYIVPKWSEVEKKMDLDHYYVQRQKDRIINRMIDVWFDWLICCDFRIK